jgi:hypothetical protein
MGGKEAPAAEEVEEAEVIPEDVYEDVEDEDSIFVDILEI